MKYYYHYTLKAKLDSIKQTGMYRDDANFTNQEYFSSRSAGQALGVMDHNIDCVLRFSDDGRFKARGWVDYSNRFSGGGSQFSHPGRPKPTAYRMIAERTWVRI